MTSRDRILSAIRSNQPERLPLPDTFTFQTHYDDLTAQFSATLAGIGGEAILVRDHAAIEAHLRGIYPDVVGITTTLPELSAIADLDLATVTSPHGLAHLHLAVIGGQIAVAENAAIWLDERDLPHRALPMITQYLAIVIRQADLVANMHEAYVRLDTFATGFGTFIAGPSKTADIEQSLVIGAHGARGLIVFVLADGDIN